MALPGSCLMSCRDHRRYGCAGLGQDIDVICFGDSDVNRFISPSLSCVYQPTEKLGREAVKMILEQINNYENYNPVKLELPTDLVIRETCSKKRITVPG